MTRVCPTMVAGGASATVFGADEATRGVDTLEPRPL